MKVVLLKDVRGVGRAHEAVNTADGHALNFLIPKKFAIAATPSALKEAEMRQKRVKEMHAVDEQMIAERLAALAETRVIIRKKINEKGHLYDAVDATELAEAAGLPESAVRIEKPYKEAGEYAVPVAYGENFGAFTISIEAE